MKEYKKSLKTLSWKKNIDGFYEWLKNESIYKCSPNYKKISKMYKKWTVFTINYKLTKKDTKKWYKQFKFYKKLCDYKKVF